MKIRQFPEGVSRTSWRTQEVRLKPHESYDISFYDTKPNIFAVSNPNEATLKFGIGKMPTSEKYEYKIDYSSSDVFGRPIGTGHLYVLNDSSLDVSFTLFSVDTEFTPDILKGTNVKVNLDNAEMRVVVQGLAEGVKLDVSDTETLAKLTALQGALAKTKTAPVYGAQNTGFSFTATTNCDFVFEWLFNDNSDVVLKKNSSPILNILKGEAFGDVRIELNSGDKLTIDSNSENSLRYKSHTES